MRNNKTKKIISNILLFVESILLFFTVILLISRISILDKNTIIKKANKLNYYEEKYNIIKENMEYTSTKSGISRSILYDVYNIDEVKKGTNKFIKGIYSNKEVEIDTNRIEERLRDNLEEYELEKGIEISDSKKNNYINKITSIYKNEITLMNDLSDISNVLSRQIKFVNILIPLLILDLAVLILVNKKIFNKLELYIPCFVSALSLIITTIYVGIHKVFIYDNKVTEIVNLAIKKGIISSIILTIIFIILGILSFKFMKNKRRDF